MLIPPKLGVDTFPKRSIALRFTERVRTFEVSERGPISKGFQVMEESALPLKANNLLLLPLKRVREV
jgi:hypothetical protein